MIQCPHQAPLFTLSLTQWNTAGPHESKTILPPSPAQRKLRKGNVFTPVCQSFCSHGGRGLASQHALGRGGVGFPACIGKGGLYPGGRGSASRGKGDQYPGVGVCIQGEGLCIKGWGLHPGEGVCIQGEGGLHPRGGGLHKKGIFEYVVLKILSKCFIPRQSNDLQHNRYCKGNHTNCPYNETLPKRTAISF